MNRKTPLVTARPAVMIEALEPRIAPAGLLNETKFTSVVVGGRVLLDASGGPNQSQGLSTAFGSYAGSYLLYLNAGKALIFTTDLNGNGILDPGEITGIALGRDSQGRAPDLTLFSDVHGDIVTNLNNSRPYDSTLTDSDNNPNNGRDGRILADTPIDKITLRTLTAADIDVTVPGNTVANRLALTHFSIYGNIISGGDFNGLSIDDSGAAALATKFALKINPYLYTGSEITIGGIQTGTAANNEYFHFTQNSPQILSGGNGVGSTELVSTNIEGTIQPFRVPNGEHGGDINKVSAVRASTLYSVGLLQTGDGGLGARGGNISDITFHGDVGGYSVIAGNGGQGATGGQGGSIVNFSDLSTVTGQAFLHTGNGGRGLLGAGGTGGTATFGTTNVAADLEVFLGNGGTGFTAGGNGAGITSTVFNTPDVTLPVGSKVVGTWHDIGDVGNLHPINGGAASAVYTYSPEVLDFDGDGHGDVIYSTTGTDQVTILFGDGAGYYDANKTIILKVPGGGSPVFTVGDFNGDGKPDVAVASGNASNFGGIDLFINQIGNQVVNPVNANNFSRNPLGDHAFSNAQFSAVPGLTNFGYYIGGHGILALAAGDFNGDGITDIGYSERVTSINFGGTGQVFGVLFGGQATSLNTDSTLVGAHTAPTFVNGSLDNGLINNTTGRPQGTGFFYSNAAAPTGVTLVQISPFLASLATPILHATSVAVGNTPRAATNGLPVAPEYLVGSVVGLTTLFVSTGNTPDPVTHLVSAPQLTTLQIDLGTVDTNRNLNSTTQQISPQSISFQDLVITDSDQDGRADIVTIASNPQTYLKIYRGSGTGTFTQATIGTNGGGDNEGIFLGNFPNPAPAGTAITTVDPTQTGRFDGFAVINLITAGTPHTEVREFRLIPATTLLLNQAALTNDVYGFDAVPTTTHNYVPGIGTVDRQISSLDAFYDTTPRFSYTTNDFTGGVLHPTTNYVLQPPNLSDVNNAYLTFFGVDTTTGTGNDAVTTYFQRFLTQNGISIYSGNGGSSSNGRGGDAGAIGDGTLNVGNSNTTTSSIQLRFTPVIEYNGSGLLQGGRGGDGFRGGGAGGSIQGVTARYNPSTGGTIGISETTVQAGNGGNGVSGNGGDGGSLRSLSIENGPAFLSGNGGNGLNGGAGGTITGNQAIFDTSNSAVTLNTGIGGQGSINGGAGGTITKWQSQIEGLGGYLIYRTGAGGTGVGGVGGAGGGILNSSPANGLNYLDGDILLNTGAGGNGLGGGAGGLISNFVNQSTTQAALPGAMTIVAGNGGIGVAGGGGVGGSIQTIQSNSSGVSSALSAFFNGLVRVIAGDGGASYGGAGGAGGSLSNVNTIATSVPMVVAAGQGGSGLTAGGLGGSVSDSTFNSAAQLAGKLLIVAGKGGDAFASQGRDIDLPNDSDVTDLAHRLLAFGGVSGVGGDGGSVIRVTQPISTETTVDIIAGNGGSTPNAGNALTAVTNVGRGGSIDGVTLAGTLGSINRNTALGQVTNPPIKSYSTATATGPSTSISDFINFLTTTQSAGFQLTDAVGNVGMVAGASGTVRGGQPAQDGINGSVSNVVASSIMSIVAGSVDRVAPVAQLSGIVVTNLDGVLGADKSPNAPYGPNGALDYYDTNGVNQSTLRAGYRLIDGAIFASNIIPTTGQPISGPRVFSPRIS